MLLNGINHVAVLTADTERFLEFYSGVFEATHEVLQNRDGFKLTLVWVGPTAELNVFKLADNTEHQRQVPMFGRGRLDQPTPQRRSALRFSGPESAPKMSQGRRTLKSVKPEVILRRLDQGDPLLDPPSALAPPIPEPQIQLLNFNELGWHDFQKLVVAVRGILTATRGLRIRSAGLRQTLAREIAASDEIPLDSEVAVALANDERFSVRRALQQRGR